ncbi:stage 0 sporulation family protein [Elusimicrobiota bacterium]
MPIIVGLMVRRIKEKAYAETAQFDVNVGERMIIETEHGQEIGMVCEKEKMVEKFKKPIGKVLRKLTQNDKMRLAENAEKSKKALKTVLQKIEDHELEMKLTCVEYTFDRSKLFIYYTSETRVDFRELIKDLGHLLKTRIQMVQIGVRDEAKMIGGIGTCGRNLCCQTFLKDFSSVTIDMAKSQDLSLNTAKLSGLCGRLMCCIAYEHESYKQCRKNLPPVGEKIKTPDGAGTVSSIDCIKEEIQVELSDKEKKSYPASKIKELNK